MGSRGTDDRQPDPAADGDEPVADEQPSQAPGRIGLSELWPPSPRVKILYIGLGFFLFNLMLLCIWALALYSTR